jgi:predicted metal-dependent HD superfamily phosphohydrolase
MNPHHAVPDPVTLEGALLPPFREGSLLHAEWSSTMSALGIDLSHSLPLLESLLASYTEPHRHYHTIEHLEEVFHTLREGGEPCSPALVLAVFFHDAVYDPRRQDNEEVSADYALDSLVSIGLAREAAEGVKRLVECTASHRPLDGDRDSILLLDADLAILASTPDRYRRYSDAIRREYDWISDDDYRKGREAVLRRFLERDRIFHERGDERAARRNLANEIALLTQ